MSEQWVDSRLVYKGKIISVRAGNARVADDVLAHREVVEHPGGVGIVPVLDDSVVLTRQYRIAMGKEVLEIPAGKLERADEDIVFRANQELEEETGYRAGRLVPIGSIFASPGYTSEEIHLFLAFDLEKVGQNLEFDECIEVIHVDFNEARRLLAQNEIKDAKTIAALHALFHHLDSDSR